MVEHRVGAFAVAGGLGALLFVTWLLFLCAEDTPPRKGRRAAEPCDFLADLALPGFKKMLLTLVPGSHPEGVLEPRGRLWRLGLSFLGHVPLSLVVLTVAIGVDTWVADTYKSWPPVEDLMIVSMGFCLVSGALAVAWAERNLLSEEAYQYNAMAQLFANGRLKMQRVLDGLEGWVDSDPARFDEGVEEAQRLILSLGREALAENAEWLILHRARPMEPIMAG